MCESKGDPSIVQTVAGDCQLGMASCPLAAMAQEAFPNGIVSTTSIGIRPVSPASAQPLTTRPSAADPAMRPTPMVLPWWKFSRATTNHAPIQTIPSSTIESGRAIAACQ